MEVSVKLLSRTDFNQFIDVIRLFEDVFEMKDFKIPSEVHLKTLIEKDDFFAFAAFLNGKIVGGLTAYTLVQYYSEKRLAYIYDLAVDTSHQRKGVGKRLIEACNEHFRAEGYEEVFVQADKVDDYAIDFYRSTRPTEEEQVVHFYYTLDT